MTEPKAIKKIKYRIATASQLVGTGVDGKGFEDLEMAIKALEEVQIYRTIGTINDCKLNKVLADKRFEYFFEGMDLLEKYKAIGTIEELQVLKEKIESK